MSYTVTVRAGPAVTRERHASLTAALDALEAGLDALGTAVYQPRRKAFVREYDPSAQVSARAEISTRSRLLPRALGGVDVRGDGSAEAYMGKMRRELVEQRPGETAIDALRRVLVG